MGLKAVIVGGFSKDGATEIRENFAAFSWSWLCKCSGLRGKTIMPGIDQVVTAIRLKDKQVDLIAHNISNANTSGFKEQRIAYDQVPNPDNSNLTLPASARTEATVYLNFNQGELIHTDNVLDVAIEGNGFMEIQTANGPVYTRNGALVLDQEGYLVTAEGKRISGRSGNIRLNGQGNVSISSSGEVTQGGTSRGTLKIVDFADKRLLEPVGASCYKPMAGAVSSVVTSPHVLQGSLEMSNVSVLSNIVQLIDASKQFQAYQKILNDQSRLDREAVGTLGRLA